MIHEIHNLKYPPRLLYRFQIVVEVINNVKKFKEFIYSINNLYHVPSRRKLSYNVLDEVHMNIQIFINKFLYKSLWITIATDGWTNIRQDYLVNFMAI
ncbi:20106_t:CDS:2, partial [Dentiscutata erythropus]